MISTCARNSFWILQKLQIKKPTQHNFQISNSLFWGSKKSPCHNRRLFIGPTSQANQAQAALHRTKRRAAPQPVKIMQLKETSQDPRCWNVWVSQFFHHVDLYVQWWMASGEAIQQSPTSAGFWALVNPLCKETDASNLGWLGAHLDNVVKQCYSNMLDFFLTAHVL